VIKKHPTKNTTQESKNYIELNNFSVYFFSLLLVALIFTSGYFFAKASSTSQSNVIVAKPTPQAQQPTQSQISLDTIKSLFSKNVIKFGNGDKKLLIVEVSDPSCPYCHVAGGVNTEIGAQIGTQFVLTSQGGSYVAPVPEMKKLVDQGKADFVWIYTNGHGNGELATKALYCAFDQGKFWQANDLLMSAKGYALLNTQIKTDTTKTGLISDFLASAVDSTKLKSCLDSGKYDSRLSQDSSLASSLGITGTPGFYLNTTIFKGAYGWNDMQSVAAAALK
jgi:protein-disulfide isomerase